MEVDATGAPGPTLLKNPQQPPEGTPDYNVAPTKRAPVVLTRASREDPSTPPQRSLRLFTWGLVPSWSKDPRQGVRMINARAETAASSSAFGPALAARRALIPALGWYEWRRTSDASPRGRGMKQPFFFTRRDGATLAMAGLYEFWRDPAIADSADPLAWLATFTILTTAAEPALAPVHERQPLVLERDHWQRWLDPTMTDPAAVADLLVPALPGRFTAYAVGTAVNAQAGNGPDLVRPLAVTSDDPSDPVPYA